MIELNYLYHYLKMDWKFIYQILEKITIFLYFPFQVRFNWPLIRFQMTEWIGLLGLQGQSKSISSFDLGVKTGDGLGPTLGKLVLNCHQDSKFRKYKMPTFFASDSKLYW